jgi:transcriptional regulator with XRE-family HTH domain
MLRKKKKLSQKQVADSLGICVRAYRDYETNGRYPRNRGRLEELASLFGKTAEYFLVENNNGESLLLEFAQDSQSVFAEDVIKELKTFLSYLDWEMSMVDIAGDDSSLCLVAESGEKRLVFAMCPVAPFPKEKERRTLGLAYGIGALIPPSLSETYYIIVTDSEEMVSVAKDLPCNLSFPVEVFSFNTQKKAFNQKKILRFIMELS